MSASKIINWSPKEYAESSVLAHEVGIEMLNRLEVVALKPRVIVDAGCGTGEFSAALHARYPNARIIAIDDSEAMLTFAASNHNAIIEKTISDISQASHSQPITFLQADFNASLLPSQSVDLIFANLLLPWQSDIKKILQACRRLLRSDGLFIFTAFGPDTLREYDEQQLDLPMRIDMHDVGDLLLQAGFSDPVLDVEYYTLEYKDPQKLIHELRATGMIGSDTLINPIMNEENKFPTTYEVIFAHTFAPAATDTFKASSDGVVTIPLTELKQKLKG